MASFTLQSNLVDIKAKKIYPAEITIANGKIETIKELDKSFDDYIMPGFIDSHIHIESSMLAPSEFARVAVRFGAVATVSDPHEIANALGKRGIEYMIESGETTPFKFFFGVPSCVPATGFESAGAVLDAKDVEELLDNPKILYLSEMMNFPGVIFDDAEVWAKINAAKIRNKPIDGHAPMLKDENLIKYVNAGISTDHECSTYEEAVEKIKLGMKVLIRAGSAAKDFDALYRLIDEYPDYTMLCSDDKHPDDLLNGHINILAKKAIANGMDLFNVLQCACINPIEHYNLSVGSLKVGDYADFIRVENLKDFNVKETYINGEKVAENMQTLFYRAGIELVNNFNASNKTPEDFRINAQSEKIRIIEVMDGSLLTKEKIEYANINNGFACADLERDILKLAVINRYNDAKPALGFVKNIGLKKGAIATSVAHDSHNIIAVGTNNEDLCRAVNEIIKNKGGMAVVNGDEILSLPLPIAGLMSALSAEETAKLYMELDIAAKKLGSQLHAPFMTLSFLALLVIPEIKLSDKGLFDGKSFNFVNLFV